MVNIKLETQRHTIKHYWLNTDILSNIILKSSKRRVPLSIREEMGDL
jgi:hypothetical protein